MTSGDRLKCEEWSEKRQKIIRVKKDVFITRAAQKRGQEEPIAEAV